MFQEVYINSRWRLVLDLLVFLPSIHYDSCGPLVRFFEINLFVRAKCFQGFLLFC